MSNRENAIETLIRFWVYQEEKRMLEHLNALKKWNATVAAEHKEETASAA